MADSIDIVLSALDATAPAIDSAISNFERYGQAAQAANEAASAGNGGVVAMVGSLFSLPGLLAASAVGAVAFGAAVATNVGGIRDTIVGIARDVWSTVTTVAANVSETVGTVLQSMADGTFDWGKLLEDVVKGAVVAFATVEFAFQNWREVGTLALVELELALVRFGNQVQYIFTEMLPAVLKSASQNWKGTFDTFKIGLKSALGMDVSASEAASAANFVVNTSFKIPDREKGELEKQLEAIAADLERGVGEGLQQNIDKRLAQVPSIMTAIREFSPRKLLADLIDSNLFKSVFGLGGGRQSASLALPGLTNERFTTGVVESGQQDIAAIMADIKAESQKQTGFMAIVSDWVKGKVPKDIRDGVKAGVEAAQTGGIVLPN